MCDIRLGIFDSFLGIQTVDEVLDLNEDGIGGCQVVLKKWISLIILIHGTIDLKNNKIISKFFISFDDQHQTLLNAFQ